MSIPIRVLVTMEVDGVLYMTGEVAELPAGQEARAREFASYGYAAEVPEEPVKPRRRKAA